MAEIYVNLKRFDVPKSYGGLCPESNSAKWIESIIGKTIKFGLGSSENVHLVYLLPESLLIPALTALKKYS